MKIPKRRKSARKETTPVLVSYIAAISDFAKLAKNCEIIEASSNGLLLQVKRTDLIPQSLRSNLNLDMLVGDQVYMRLEDMNLELTGKIVRTKLLGKKGFVIAIDYTDNAPKYWRECLMDLLPQPGEID